MLSLETERKLVQIFVSISLGESKINKMKQDILTNYSINPIQFFFKLNKNNSNYITKSDISNYLNSFNIIYTPTDIDYIFYFYDKDFDNVLNFYEFLNLIISDSSYLYKKTFKKKFKHNKIEQSDLNTDIDINIQKGVLQIFIEEIEFARQLNDLIMDIKQCNDFVLQDIFYEIKSYSYITSESLKAFFDRNEVSYNDKFIKNIFNRFDNKEINGRISFNKFKSFFDLPYGKNSNENQNINFVENKQNFNENEIPKILNHTHVSDINLSDSNNIIYSNKNEPNLNYEENVNNLNNNNFINEEDIQFECSHLSRSGSVESKKEKENNNCKYVTKNNKNNLYKTFLRDKRSKSLEKSLSRSLSRKSNVKIDKHKITENNKNNIRNIRVIADDNNHSMNDGMSMSLSNSNSSYNEDIPVKLPVRLDKNLVKRPLPKRINKTQNYEKNKMDYNSCYHDCPQNYNRKNNNYSQYCNNYYDENVAPNESEINTRPYNRGMNDIVCSNNLDLKIYKEDFGNNRTYNENFE